MITLADTMRWLPEARDMVEGVTEPTDERERERFINEQRERREELWRKLRKETGRMEPPCF